MALQGCLSPDETEANPWSQMQNRAVRNRPHEVTFEVPNSPVRKEPFNLQPPFSGGSSYG